MMSLTSNGLVLELCKELQDYLSYEIMFSADTNKVQPGQPYLYENLEENFEKLVMCNLSPKTPSTPKFLIIRPMENKD